METNSTPTEINSSANPEEKHEVYELPPPPSKDQILGDIEEIKQQYREQTDGWNKHLDDSRREADERLQKMLSQYNQSWNFVLIFKLTRLFLSASFIQSVF